METYYYKDRNAQINSSSLVINLPEACDVHDYLIDYYKELVKKACPQDTYKFLFLYIAVIIIYIIALSNILLLKFLPKKTALSNWIEKYMPFMMNEGLAILFLFLATILTSFIGGYSLIFFFFTSIIFIIISIHKSKCNGLIRWPLFTTGGILLLFVLISAFGNLFNYLSVFVDLFKYTTILSSICIIMDYKIFLQKKCVEK